MINQLNLSSFKSFPEQELKIKDLTLLSGVNNSGKSSLIQTLRMYERAANNLSPLLEGYGLVKELRSKFASNTSDIEVILSFDDGQNSKMSLSDHDVSRPKICPVVFYIGADRLGPQLSLPLNGSLDSYPVIGDQGEFVIDLISKLNDSIIPERLVHESSQGKTLEYALSGWLNEIAPGVEFKYKTNSMADSAHAEIDTVRPKNVGFGISYTLPIIAAILGMASSPPAQGWSNNWGESWSQKKISAGSLIILENPEAHLHPQGQTAMGRLIAAAVASGVQVIVETHSDHLMDGIRIAVKDGVLSSDSVAFHFLSKLPSGISHIETPCLYPDGKLEYWPKGFFDQTLKNRALLAKKGS